jgi:tetratricopeptide (TPR) repeat protein
MDIAEAQLRTGAAGDARTRLDRIVARGTQNEHGLRALLLLAEANEALGDQRAALVVYDRLRRDHPQAPWPADRLLAHARLLQGAGNGAAARPVLEQVLQRGDAHAMPEATYRLGEITSADGQHASAAEWFMSAAYLANGTTWKPRALLGAARSLVALNEMNEALIVYQKLLADQAQSREVSAEAAYGAGDVLRRTGRHEAAIQMFLAAAHHVPNSGIERRALVGAMRCFVATGDRTSAETIYRRLLASNTMEPELLAEARKVLALNQ